MTTTTPPTPPQLGQKWEWAGLPEEEWLGFSLELSYLWMGVGWDYLKSAGLQCHSVLEMQGEKL